jgi:hypothetical protein
MPWSSSAVEPLIPRQNPTARTIAERPTSGDVPQTALAISPQPWAGNPQAQATDPRYSHHRNAWTIPVEGTHEVSTCERSNGRRKELDGGIEGLHGSTPWHAVQLRRAVR